MSENPYPDAAGLPGFHFAGQTGPSQKGPVEREVHLNINFRPVAEPAADADVPAFPLGVMDGIVLVPHADGTDLRSVDVDVTGLAPRDAVLILDLARQALADALNGGAFDGPTSDPSLN